MNWKQRIRAIKAGDIVAWRSTNERLPELTVGQKIGRDHQRFRKRVRGKVKSNLNKYIGRGEMIG